MNELMRADHAEIRAILADLRGRLALPDLEDPAGFGQARWRLTRCVTRHLAVEDAHVYRHLQSDPRPEVAAVVRWFKHGLDTLLTDFTAHVRRWQPEAIRADWPGYRRELTQLLDTLETRIDLEETRLYPLLYESRAA